MISKSLTIRFLASRALLLFVFLMGYGAAHQLQAQNAVNVINAESIDGGTYQGEQVKKILNNVHLRSKNLEVYCDSAYQFVNQDEIRAYGNVQVNTESEKIWADTLTYFTDVDFSQLRGRDASVPS
ncbi:MAG: OstA-like protein [Fodinibius sp.]|nr:OstA-like protein [Fodinibius sp.]